MPPLSLPCYRLIGVDGDRSCPQLAELGHCRHCPMFAEHGRKLFEQEIPAAALGEWTDVLARPLEERAPGTVSVVVFQVADEWLAVGTAALQEVAEMRPVHFVPHRSNRIFRGLANINGELLLAVSLADLLGVAESAASTSAAADATARLLVLNAAGTRFVMTADDIHGIFALTPGDLHDAPVTLAKAPTTLTRYVFHLQEHEVGLLDEEKLAQALARSLA